MSVSPAIIFLLLGVATAAIAALGAITWWRTRNVAFLVGLAALYYWSLFGAWTLVQDLVRGTSGARYEYLFTKLFPIELNLDFALTIALYATFILVLQGTTLFMLPQRRSPRLGPADPLHIFHPVLLTVAGLAGSGSYLIIRPFISQAVALNLSIYNAISTEVIAASIPLYTVHQLLIEIALIAAAIGAAVYASGHSARYIRGRTSAWTALGYVGLLPALTAFSFMMGKRHEPFFALLAGAVFYLANAPRPRLLRMGVIGLLGVLGLGLVDLVRSAPLAAIRGESMEAGVGGAVGRLVSSNEMYAAHFSLYGVLRYDVPLTYGSSFVSLAAAAVPRALGVPRPEDIYVHYARGVGAIDNQQYSIHHATGWYLNFGVPGVALGGVLLGALWGWLYRIFLTSTRRRGVFARAFSVLAFCAFSAGMPRIVRAGPEVYKSVVFELLLIPAALVGVASLRIDLGMARAPRRALPTREEGLA